MKPTIFILLLTLAFAACKKDDTPPIECPNKVTNCVIAIETRTDNFGTRRITYNKEGKIVKESYLSLYADNSIKVHYVTRNSYENNRLKMMTKDNRNPISYTPGMPQYTPNYNAYHSITHYTYNGNIATGITSHVDITYGERVVYTTKDEITFNNDGKKLEQKLFDEDNVHYQTLKWTYDELGNVTLEERIGINKDGTLGRTYYDEYIFNEKNQLITHSSWNGKSKSDNKYASTYDYSYNDCGEMILESYQKGHYKGEHRYDYDEHGNVINDYIGDHLVSSYTYYCP